MLKTALAFSDDDFDYDDSLNSNLNTVIGQQAYRKAKALCHQLAMDDPATILKGIASLPKADQLMLSYLRNKARKILDIYRHNNPGSVL